MVRQIFAMHKYLYYFLVLGIFISSCSNEDDIIAPKVSAKLTAYNQRVVNYFKEIALGFEFGNASEITRRWEGGMKIFMGGSPSPELRSELDKIITELNDLSTTPLFKIESVSDTLQSNFYIYFGSDNSYATIFPSQASLTASNLGLFTIYWNGANELIRGHMYIDIFRTNQTEQRHLLREELTQSLGLAKDSSLYPESIFQQAFSTKTTEYAQIDKDVIRLLYHPQMTVGLNRNEVDAVLTEILLAEQ